MRNGMLATHLTVGLWVAFVLAPMALSEWNLSQLAQYMAYGIFAMALAFLWRQVRIRNCPGAAK